MAQRYSYVGPWEFYSDPTSCVLVPTPTQYAPPPPSQPSSNVLSIPPNTTAIPEPVSSVSSIQDRATDAVPPPSSPHLAYDSGEPSDLTDMETSDGEGADYDAVAKKAQDEASSNSESQPECDWDEMFLNEAYSDHEDAGDGEYLPDADDQGQSRTSSVEQDDGPPRKNWPRAVARRAGPRVLAVAAPRRSRRLAARSTHDHSSDGDYGLQSKKRKAKSNSRLGLERQRLTGV